ncbi:MAG: amidohydrolase, partial [Spartobacteria bacterium]|nr:amidohydrolase [Spartobacteria bacterium]
MRGRSTSLGSTGYKFRMKIRFFVFVALLFTTSLFAQRTPQSLADSELPSLLTIYKDLHTNPELSTQEQRTAAIVAKELKATGCEVTENFGKYVKPGVKCYGVIGVMKNGNGPTILVRTDLDALPVEEQTGLPYASKVMAKNDEGKDVHVMHACGHDVHMSIFLGAARTLAKLKDQWHGTIMFVGQPAEETVGGARALLADGLYTKF